MKERNYMRAYVINNNGSSNNLPCYPTAINFRMLSIGGQQGRHKKYITICHTMPILNKNKYVLV